MNRLLVFLCLLLPLSAAACGDDDKPSGGDVAKQLEKSGVPKEQAQCMGKAYEDAGFTSGDISKINNGDFDLTSAKGKKFSAAITKCLGLSTPTS